MSENEQVTIDNEWLDSRGRAEGRAEDQADQEEAYWNDLCNGFIKMVYFARSEYSRALLQADQVRNDAVHIADRKLYASMSAEVHENTEFRHTAFAASLHAREVIQAEDTYTNKNVTAVTQFKNDVEAAATYMAQRAINIVSAGQG